MTSKRRAIDSAPGDASPRRLPIVSIPPASSSCQVEAEPRRSALQWWSMTTLAIMLVWAPLALLALWTVRLWLVSSAGCSDPQRLAQWFANLTWSQGIMARAITMGLPVAAFLLACGSVGAMVGRWSNAPPKPIGYAGTTAASMGWLLGAVRTGLTHALPTLVTAGLFGFAGAWAGFQLGRKLRNRHEKQFKRE